ncbi:MAG: (2Fe-2S) ferredoxin domain-containing protein [Pirellulales bacterium]
MAQFTHHLFVCCNQREPGKRQSCDPKGSEELRAAFKKEIERRGLKPDVRANSAGCLDQCELGPVCVIYPQAIWYGNVQVSDVPRIVEETIVQGKIVEELRIPDEQLNTKGKKS